MSAPAGKWWGDGGEHGVPCAGAEQYRQRVGSYTMRLLFQFQKFVAGETCSDERFEFSPEARQDLEMHLFVLIEKLRTGQIRRRPGTEQLDVDFQRFMGRTIEAAPAPGRRGTARRR